MSSLPSWGRGVGWSLWASWWCKRLLFIYIIPRQQQRDLLWGVGFFHLGVSRTCLSCVPMCSAFSGCRISENLPGEAQLYREQPAEHLWSVSGDGLLACGCIYRASVLSRQGKRGDGEGIFLALLLGLHLRSNEMWLKGQKVNLWLISFTYFSLLFLCVDQDGTWKQY